MQCRTVHIQYSKLQYIQQLRCWLLDSTTRTSITLPATPSAPSALLWSAMVGRDIQGVVERRIPDAPWLMTYCHPAPYKIAMWTLHWTRVGGYVGVWPPVRTPTARASVAVICASPAIPMRESRARARRGRGLTRKGSWLICKMQNNAQSMRGTKPHPPHKAKPHKAKRWADTYHTPAMHVGHTPVWSPESSYASCSSSKSSPTLALRLRVR